MKLRATYMTMSIHVKLKFNKMSDEYFILNRCEKRIIKSKKVLFAVKNLLFNRAWVLLIAERARKR